MDIFDLARQHYTAQRAQTLGAVEVPEWADEAGNVPVIHVRSMNLTEDSQRTRYALDRDLCNFNVYTLIFCACDEQLKPVFRKEDADFVANQMCSTVVSRVVTQINKILDSKQAGDIEPEKKS